MTSIWPIRHLHHFHVPYQEIVFHKRKCNGGMYYALIVLYNWNNRYTYTIMIKQNLLDYSDHGYRDLKQSVSIQIENMKHTI